MTDYQAGAECAQTKEWCEAMKKLVREAAKPGEIFGTRCGACEYEDCGCGQKPYILIKSSCL